MDEAEMRAFAEASQGGPRLIGIDLGTKTIGLALSDVGRQIASPAPVRICRPPLAEAPARASSAPRRSWGPNR